LKFFAQRPAKARRFGPSFQGWTLSWLPGQCLTQAIVSYLWHISTPTGFIQQHQGWLTVHITCGFTSQRGTLRLANGDLPSLGWFIHAQTGPWSPERFIHWGEEVAEILLSAYRSVGMPNYNAWLNQLDEYSTQAMDDCVEIAWQTLLACHPLRENHRALFNPMDECWRFSDSPIDHYYPI
jgi:hypothetical protein